MAAPSSPGGFRRTGSSTGPSTTTNQSKDSTKFSGIKADGGGDELKKKMADKKISDDDSTSKSDDVKNDEPIIVDEPERSDD